MSLNGFKNTNRNEGTMSMWETMPGLPSRRLIANVCSCYWSVQTATPVTCGVNPSVSK